MVSCREMTAEWCFLAWPEYLLLQGAKIGRNTGHQRQMITNTALHPLRIKFPFLCERFPQDSDSGLWEAGLLTAVQSRVTSLTFLEGQALEKLPLGHKSVFTFFHLGPLSDLTWKSFFILYFLKKKKKSVPSELTEMNCTRTSTEFVVKNILCQLHTHTHPFLGNVPRNFTCTFWSLLICVQCLFTTLSVTGKV